MKQIILILILTFLTTTKVIACDCPLRPDTKEDFESEWNAFSDKQKVCVEILQLLPINQIRRHRT